MLPDLSAGVHVVRLDVTEPKSIESAAKAIQEESGHFDILINNAA